MSRSNSPVYNDKSCKDTKSNKHPITLTCTLFGKWLVLHGNGPSLKHRSMYTDNPHRVSGRSVYRSVYRSEWHGHPWQERSFPTISDGSFCDKSGVNDGQFLPWPLETLATPGNRTILAGREATTPDYIPGNTRHIENSAQHQLQCHSCGIILLFTGPLVMLPDRLVGRN